MADVFAVIIELALCCCMVWMLFFLSTFLHEIGHALGYMFATGDRHWHIRVGSGKCLLDTGRLTVKLLPFDGCFVPTEKNRINTKGKLITVLAGGPVLSLITVIGLLPLRLGRISLQTQILAPGAVDFLTGTAFSVNLFILVLSLIPVRCFHGEIKGMETDALQIVNAIRSKEE